MIKCPLKIGHLYKTTRTTMLFTQSFVVSNFPENQILLLIESAYNMPEQMWCLTFLFENQIFLACNHLTCDNLGWYFQEIIEE